jgi:hypothetical protein
MPQFNGSFRGNWIKNTNLSMVKLYPQLCYLEYIHNQIHSNSNLKKRLDALLKEHSNVDIAAMGFPKDWKNEPLWK